MKVPFTERFITLRNGGAVHSSDTHMKEVQLKQICRTRISGRVVTNKVTASGARDQTCVQVCKSLDGRRSANVHTSITGLEGYAASRLTRTEPAPKVSRKCMYQEYTSLLVNIVFP
jgi:hypothetical protein